LCILFLRVTSDKNKSIHRCRTQWYILLSDTQLTDDDND